MSKYIIAKSTEKYEGGPGYSGRTCEWASVEVGRIYDTEEEAKKDAERMMEYNRGAKFKVLPYKEKKHVGLEKDPLAS